MKTSHKCQLINGFLAGSLGRLLSAGLIATMITLMPGLGGCQEGQKRTDPISQPQPITAQAHPIKYQLDSMTNNALLANMAVSDMHFIPHRPYLTDLGCQELNRMAWFVQRYGSTIILDLAQQDSDLAKYRKKVVEDYLLACGLPAEKVEVVFAMPASTGLPADEAVAIYKGTRYKPPKKQK